MKTSNRTWLIAVLLLAFAVLCRSEDRRTDKSVLVIMSLNAEFLWDGVPPEQGQVNFDWKGSQSEAEDHMAKVATVVIQGNPDILNLVEVENLDALTTFNNKFLAGRGYRPFLVEGTDTYTGEDVGLLTRIDPEGGTISRDDRHGQMGGVSKAVSKNYEARFAVDGTRFSLIGIHLLAFPNMQARRLEREAQADAVRAIALDERNAGFPPVVLGDFNDYDGNADSKDHIDSTPITSVLSMIRALDASTAADDLVNAASLVPKPLRYTAFHDANQNGEVDPPNELTSIDHILLSPELAAKAETVQIPHNHDPRLVTDHFPVVVRLKLTATPTPSASQVRIARLVPNPPGDDTQNEEATIKNTGTSAVTMTGWKLRDLSKRTWSLDSLASLAPGESKTIKRDGQPMSLNNGGDTIDLVDPTGTVAHTVTYSSVVEGEVVVPAN